MSQADSHAWRRWLAAGPALVLGMLAIARTTAAAGPPGVELAASLSSREIALGGPLSVTGRLTSAGQGLAGIALTLQVDPWPYRGFTPVSRGTTAPDGGFSFAGLRPDRNARFRVVSEGSPALTGADLTAIVDPVISGGARSLGPGRVRLTLRMRHTITGSGRPASAWWFLAARRSPVFRLAAVTGTRELSRGVSYASVIVDPPARRFVYRVCVNPPWEAAMGPPATHRRCPRASFVIGRDAH